MGVKISELGEADKLEGSELLPIVQSVTTLQTHVSSVFTALTSQADGRYLNFTNLTLNSLPKVTNTSGIVSDSVITDNGGNVGIGTTTPNEKLTVSGNISATGGLNVGGDSSFTGNFIDFDAGTSMNFAGQPATFDNAVSFTNGAHFDAEDVCVTNANVGIGTTTPNERLTVSGNISATGDITTSNINVGDLICHTGDPNTYISFSPNIVDIGAGINDGPGIQISTGVVAINEDNDPDMDLCVRYSGGTALFADGNSGNIGIGTTTPNEKLTVSGSISGSDGLIIGKSNTAAGCLASVAGGFNNTACGSYSNVAGGLDNAACGGYSNVAGGCCNEALCTSSNIAGGYSNVVCGNYSNVAGGNSNTASGSYSNVAGGASNTASCSYSNVAGGTGNDASASYSSVAGGSDNTVAGCASFVGSGTCNQVGDTDYSAIVAGYENCVGSCTDGGFIGGGQQNSVTGVMASVVGGVSNCACASCSTVIGGGNNTVKSAHSYASIVGTTITSVSANMLHVNRLYASDLPTTNPGVTGVVWNDGGTLKIS